MNIHEYQFNRNKSKIQTIIKNAIDNVPYFQNTLDKDYDYYTRDYNTWLEIPILSKSLIQENINAFINISTNITDSDIKYSHTSGSTGIPLKVYKDQYSEMRIIKKLWSLRKNWEKDLPNWKLLYLYRKVEDIYYKNVLRLGENDDYLDLSQNSLLEYCDQIIKYQPQWIIGPPIVTSKIANMFLDNKIEINSIKFAEMYGEMLLPHYIETIQNAFQCKTINHYGARELNVLSYECPCGAMHPLDDYYLFEIINKEESDDSLTGELIVTSLTNMVMPLIRYSVGDICLLKFNTNPCHYNESKVTLMPKLGRVSDLIMTESNIMASGIIDSIFSGFINKYPSSIKQFQVIQKDIKNFDVILIAGKNYNYSLEDELKWLLINAIGNSIFKFQYVQSIKHEKSRKSKSFIPINKKLIEEKINV